VNVMLRRIEAVPDGIVCLRATGTVTSSDYERVAVPMFREALNENRHVRLLYHLTVDVSGSGVGIVLGDVRTYARDVRLLQRCALVTHLNSLRAKIEHVSAIVACPVRGFDEAEWNNALDWLGGTLRVDDLAVAHTVV
jgi:hypothetical protein